MKHPLPYNPLTQFLFLLFSVFVSFFVINLLGALIAIPVFQVSFTKMFEIFEQGDIINHIAFFKYFQILQSFSVFVVPPFIVAWLYSRNSFSFLRLNIPPLLPTYFLLFLLMFFSIPIINHLVEINQNLSFPESLKSVEQWMSQKEENANQIMVEFLKADNISALLLNLFMIAVLPAVGEELLFRGVLQRLIGKWLKNKHVGIFLAAVLFSAMHLQFYGFLPRLALGILFGYLFLWSGTLWLPIMAHFINNATAVIAFYVTRDESFVNKPQAYDYSWGWIVLSLILVGTVCWFIYYLYRDKSNPRKV
jgi:membrane protease YdiL (CAAX protease family)